jgi:hypothetical protein
MMQCIDSTAPAITGDENDDADKGKKKKKSSRKRPSLLFRFESV